MSGVCNGTMSYGFVYVCVFPFCCIWQIRRVDISLRLSRFVILLFSIYVFLFYTTNNNGSLGSEYDEERSKWRYII